MKRTLQRLSLALALSLAVFGGSLYFSKRFESNNLGDKTQKPVAFAKQINDEVERRPVASLVWNLVGTGEPLYPGEAIKTSDKGEVRIQFAQSSRFIDLDPDSLIVISQAGNNEISLDLQGGSLFVSQGNSADPTSENHEPALTLNSEAGKVDLSQATAQLSKTAGKDIDVQVLKGKAKVESNGQSKDLENSKKISNLEILFPALDKPFFLNPENPQPVAFKWKGFPANSVVTLHAGKTRKDLKVLSSVSEVTETSLNAKFPVGKHFWKLVAKDKDSQKTVQESGLYRLEVASRYAPAALAPTVDAQILKSEAETDVNFKWTKPEAASAVYLEIAKDIHLKDKVFSKNILDQDSLKQALPEGVYFWRLSASYDGIDKQISTKAMKFTITQQIKPKEAPKPVVAISWIDPEEKKPQYFVDTPLASLAWASEQKSQVKSWRLKLAKDEKELSKDSSSEIISHDTKDLSMKMSVKNPGRYIAMVEALDEKQQILAKSNFKSIDISPLPLLDSPQFLPETGDLKANNQGQLDLKWGKIEGAKEYWLTLYDESGKEIRKAKFQGDSTTLVNLLPGQYKVAIHAIDQYGRESESEKPRNVVVPSGSNLLAPKFKKIKVN